MGQIVDIETLLPLRKKAKEENHKVVFTNGCFDILHRGHIEYLNEAKALGDILILGLNSDVSVRALKGKERPLNIEEDRAIILANLCSIDYVIIFDELTPAHLIEQIIPDILVKGGDYKIEEIIGRKTVWANGGEVIVIPEVQGRSSRNSIQIILERYS